MSIKVVLVSEENGRSAKITDLGGVGSADLKPSKFRLGSTASNNVAVNIIPPLAFRMFVITAIILSGDRSIGNDGAVTDIFETSIGPTDGTIETRILQEEIAKQTRMVISGLEIHVTPGVWVNVKSDDVIVRANIAGYYLDITRGNMHESAS
jgi:hypothetical protein